jgi:hypothetical protein
MSEINIKRAIEDVDNYEQSVLAAACFIHIYKWDNTTKRIFDDVCHWIGKEYTTTQGAVTPDITLQLANDRGLVVELKPKLPQDETHWGDAFKQLKNYDTALSGWKTDSGKVNQQELVLITDQKISKKIIEYIKAKNLSFSDYSKNFCVIQYGPANGAKQAYYLRKEYGNIDDFRGVTDRELEIDGVTVEMDYLVSTGLIKIKILDYEPPPIYLMSILWDHIFSSMISEDDWRKSKMEDGKKIVEIKVDVPQLKKILQENYADPNAKRSIEESWIQKALDTLVTVKLASRNHEQERGYIIKFRKKIKGEKDGTNKNQLFAELLYGEGIQTTLESKK